MQQDNISGFANVSTSLMIDFMVVIIDHPHCMYMQISVVWQSPRKQVMSYVDCLFGNITV